MLIMVKEKKFCRKSALKVLDFSLQNAAANCANFVRISGLKTLFAAFMKKGAIKNKKVLARSRYRASKREEEATGK